MSIAQAIQAVEDKGIDTDLELYDVIENSPGESVYSLAKLMAWSNGKTYASVRRLEKSKLVHITYAAHALRAVMLKGAGVADILYPDLLALGVFFLIFFAAATLMLRREVG